jgi:hypothetical protein
MNFSQKKFIDIGQTLYIEWLNSAVGLYELPEAKRLELFKTIAEYSFEAAAEFAKVFDHQEDT